MSVILPFPSPPTPRSRGGYDAVPNPLVVLAGALRMMHSIRPTRAQEIDFILDAPRDDGPVTSLISDPSPRGPCASERIERQTEKL